MENCTIDNDKKDFDKAYLRRIKLNYFIKVFSAFKFNLKIIRLLKKSFKDLLSGYEQSSLILHPQILEQIYDVPLKPFFGVFLFKEFSSIFPSPIMR